MRKIAVVTVTAGLLSLLPIGAADAAAGMPYGVQYAYDGQDVGAWPGYIKLNGSYPPNHLVSLSDTDGMGIHQDPNHPPTKLYWEQSGQRQGVHYVLGKAFFPGQATPGTVLNYALDNKTTNNGYLLVANQNILDWVSYLGGNPQFVTNDLNNLNSYSQIWTAKYDHWDVANLSHVIAACGATIDFDGGEGSNYMVDSGGTTASPAFIVKPTQAPRSSIQLAQTSYDVGTKVPINLTADIYAAATNWHLEAVHITGNGVDTYVPIANQSKAASGEDFDHLAPVPGGSDGTFKEYKDVATWDTTGLKTGTYKIDYVLYDAVERSSTSGSSGVVSTTVTLTPAGTGNPPGTGGSQLPTTTTPTTGGNPADPNSKMNLSIKFNPFTMPIPIGGATIPVTVSNNGDQDVTTDVVLTRNGKKPIAVYANSYDVYGNVVQYVDHYNNIDDTQTLTQTVTIPKHGAKQLTFTVFTGQGIIGTNPNLHDDPQYTFQIVADVNKGKTIIENTYSDNETSMWVPTQGKQYTISPPRIIE